MTWGVRLDTARDDADLALADANSYGGRLEDRDGDDTALAVCLAARAVCLELRALGLIVERSVMTR